MNYFVSNHAILPLPLISFIDRANKHDQITRSGSLSIRVVVETGTSETKTETETWVAETKTETEAI